MLWRRARVPLAGWVATFLLAAAMVAFSFFVAPWGWFGVPLRYLLVALFAAAVLISLRRAPQPDTKPESPLRTIGKVLLALLFGSVAMGAVQGRRVPPGAVPLSFPLRGGSYLVVHGGSTGHSNSHNIHPAQRFALDVTKLNAVGMRARGLFPAQLERYAIFGTEVVSPCDGMIASAVDGLQDLTPPVMEPKSPAGNHVIVRCGGVDVTLAHFQKGSVAVRPGEAVARLQTIGKVGNSGNTSEPHLHIHAERGGKGVPVIFDGNWLVRNEVIRPAAQ